MLTVNGESDLALKCCTLAYIIAGTMVIGVLMYNWFSAVVFAVVGVVYGIIYYPIIWSAQPKGRILLGFLVVLLTAYSTSMRNTAVDEDMRAKMKGRFGIMVAIHDYWWGGL